MKSFKPGAHPQKLGQWHLWQTATHFGYPWRNSDALSERYAGAILIALCQARARTEKQGSQNKDIAPLQRGGHLEVSLQANMHEPGYCPRRETSEKRTFARQKATTTHHKLHRILGGGSL
ncbi:hypothetical protein N7G274_006751 [Stereocaulon virgatum]|uniref:Uncharacterized protein n=1 Tax=Stereocaulon virgatum TaxID=373712 RepID=A0ABR4A5G5_9LECA